MDAYLDNAATTQCLNSAAELMNHILCEEYGNPSSLHERGVRAERYLRDAREIIAGSLHVKEKEIFFTSGGTESDNLAIIGTALANARAGRHLITTQIEHPAVLASMRYLEEQGFSVTYLPVDGEGRIRISDLERELRPDTILVSIMHTNNEIGSLQPIEEAGEAIARLCPNAVFHVDAVQGYGKARIYPKRQHIGLLCASAHKIHGPKGIGFLYVDEKVKIRPLLFGGGQQRGLRSGTENVPAIAGMARAAETLYGTLEEDNRRLYALKETFAKGLLTLDGVRINGPACRQGASHILNATFSGVKSEVLLHALEERGIYVSAGSACSAHHPGTSKTLKAIGLSDESASCAIRFSFSIFTTMEEIQYTLKALGETLPVLRRYRAH